MSKATTGAIYFKRDWTNPKDHRSYTIEKGNKFGIITAKHGRPFKRYFISPASNWDSIEPIVLRVTNDRLQPKDYASVLTKQVK